ncbi:MULTISPECIES: hypothetical protein [Marinobacter]|uniref:Uncharacterized protein n=1 Tax=Marinobacter xiaoshiensis TaxID=3073652 RepID=A0ABU2HIB2_9GAMM|nr:MULTISPECIES: hypothetical protein [unclassified Marinobacter]MBK1873359.1 hypothetical protein [Marinobacter sp. 1-3A]MDS1310799.1 hypothetical protein [Marinobacter sp. F60267]
MSPVFLKIAGLLAIGMAVFGLLTGKVPAGTRGFKTNYYHRNENPFLFYGFIVIYLVIGMAVLVNSG